MQPRGGEKNNWRARLRGDPANWLLDADDNPSVAFWFLRDIVGRPEDAAAMVNLREKILFSPPVQEIFATQNELGYWDNPHRLDEPRHSATLWALARLSELGIPRTSRRARAACEFALENFRLADKSLAGLIAHALLYFNNQNDPRLAPIFDSLRSDAEQGDIFALWALADFVMLSEAKHLVFRQEDALSRLTTRPFADAQGDILGALERGAETILDALARGEFTTFGAFPSFDPRDSLLALRVLAQLNRLGDARAEDAIEQVWARQGEGARWALDTSYDGAAMARGSIAPTPNKWATLNVLRVITKT